jgi:hypothetical protein
MPRSLRGDKFPRTRPVVSLCIADAVALIEDRVVPSRGHEFLQWRLLLLFGDQSRSHIEGALNSHSDAGGFFGQAVVLIHSIQNMRIEVAQNFLISRQRPAKLVFRRIP